jgi:hypothetical protein
MSIMSRWRRSLILDEILESGSVQLGLPTLVRVPFVAALPIEIGFVAKVAGKMPQEFTPCPQRLAR